MIVYDILDLCWGLEDHTANVFMVNSIDFFYVIYSSLGNINSNYALVAQSIQRWVHVREVPGSNPGWDSYIFSSFFLSKKAMFDCFITFFDMSTPKG